MRTVSIVLERGDMNCPVQLEISIFYVKHWFYQNWEHLNEEGFIRIVVARVDPETEKLQIWPPWGICLKLLLGSNGSSNK